MSSFNSVTSTDEYALTDNGNFICNVVLEEEDESLDNTVENILEWADGLNIIEGGTSKDQLAKLMQEVGEVSEAVCKNDIDNLEEEIGDCMVVLAILAEQNGVTLQSCSKTAYDKIKTRTGILYDGVFIKSTDKNYEDVLQKLGRV